MIVVLLSPVGVLGNVSAVKFRIMLQVGVLGNISAVEFRIMLQVGDKGAPGAVVLMPLCVPKRLFDCM